MPKIHRPTICVYGQLQLSVAPYDLSQEMEHRFESLLESLITLRLPLPNYFERDDLFASFSVISKDEIPEHLKFIFHLSPYKLSMPTCWVRVELVASFDYERILKELADWHEEEAKRIALFDNWLVEDIGERLQHTVLIANIASPGTIDLIKSVGQSEYRGLHNFRPARSDLMAGRRRAESLNWPPVKDLQLQEVAKWIEDNSLLSRQGDCPLSRAFNAYTHLFGDFDEVGSNEILLYSLIGVEALYNNSREQIGQQVNQKCQTFLGSLNSSKKSLTQMYSYRSGFVHGGEPFPGKYDKADATQEYGKYFDKVNEAGDLASVVLVSTLQRMAELRLSELSFQYHLSTE